jgi:2-octaprenylphenol hydroxylase
VSHEESVSKTATSAADVIIVGAGLVGSALTCALTADSDLRVVVVDAQLPQPVYPPEKFDPRVVALSAAAVEFLRELDTWAGVASQRHCPYRGMEVWDGEGNGRIRFSADDLHRDQLGFIVENSVVLQALHQVMQSRVTYLAPVSIASWDHINDLNQLTLSDGRVLVAPLIIGADGGHSRLRELAHIPVNAWAYNHSAIVTTVRTRAEHGFIARQRFSHQGPLAFLPLQNGPADPGYYCSIVWSLDEEVAARMMALDDAEFCAQLTRVSEACLGEVEWADQRHVIPLWQRHAAEYGRPGFALVGDAAHTIHPLAGQGVNLGLYDAQALAAEILRAHRRSVPLNHASVVQRYQRQRKFHNLSAMASMEGFKRLFGADVPPLLALRNRGLNWVDSQLWLKRLLMQVAAGDL